MPPSKRVRKRAPSTHKTPKRASFLEDSVPYLTVEGEPSGLNAESNQYHSTVNDIWHARFQDGEGGGDKQDDPVDGGPGQGEGAAGGANGDVAVIRAWYDKSAGYWGEQSADIGGMLGGFDDMHEDDIRESRLLLTSLFPQCKEANDGKGGNRNNVRALDCGAGIGRVSKHLLCRLCGGGVDLMDTVPQFVQRARFYVDDDNLKDTFTCSMQEFTPTESAYDVIWVQWCVMYLTDRDLIAFLKRCTRALKPGGVIVVKDNITRPETGFVFDSSDNSFVRSVNHFKAVFSLADLRIVQERDQRRLPAEVMRIKMWALQPSGDAQSSSTSPQETAAKALAGSADPPQQQPSQPS